MLVYTQDKNIGKHCYVLATVQLSVYIEKNLPAWLKPYSQ